MSEKSNFVLQGIANTRAAAAAARKAYRHQQKMEKYHQKLSPEEREQALRSGIWSQEQQDALRRFYAK